MGSTQQQATLANWRESPYNRWAFTHVNELIRTDVVIKPEQSSRLESQPRKLDDFSIEIQGEKLDLPTFISKSSTDSLIVLQHGKVLYEGYFNGNDESSKHIIMSMTKSVTGLLVGIMQEHGLLHVDDLVAKYVPEVKDSFYGNVTIRQCLDMRSGAKYLDGTQEYRAAVGWNPEDGSEEHTTLHDFIANFDPERVEDDRWEYVSVNTDLVGWVVERAGGRKFAKLIEDFIWQPMGAESDAWVATDKEGSARAAGGLCVTLRDIARLGQVVVEDGKGIVPSEWLHDIVHGGSKEAFAKSGAGAAFGESANLAYRSYSLADSSTELVTWLGIHGQMLYADRKNGIVVAKTSSQAEPFDVPLLRMAMLMFREFQRILTA